MKPLIPIAVALALIVTGCRKTESAEEEPEAPVLTVSSAVATTGPIRELLPLNGSYVLAPSDFARLASPTSGVLKTISAKEGDHVQMGQILARIDTRVLDAQRSGASISYATAQALAKQSESSLRAARAEFAANVKAAELNLQAVKLESDGNIAEAKVELDKLRAGARPQEIGLAEQAVVQAEVARNRAHSEAERDQKLLAEGLVSGQQAEASKSAYEVAESALTQAKQQLDLTKIGARSEDLRAAELRYKSAKELGAKKVEAAKASLAQARQGQLGLDGKVIEVRAARLAAAEKSLDAEAARGLAAFGEVRAPFDGIIVRRFLGEGETVDSATPVFEIARNGATIDFSGHVAARLAPKLSVGMKVIIESGTPVSGTIRSVGVADAQTGQTPVRVVLSSKPHDASAGTFARLQVILRTSRNAVLIPEEAVISREDKRVAFVIESGIAAMREVEVGPSESGMVSILKGLRKGDKVVLVGQHELSDGAKVVEAKPEAAP